MRRRSYSFRRTRRLQLPAVLIAIVLSLFEVLRVKHALVKQSNFKPEPFGDQKIFIAGMHWNSEWILREAWMPAVIDLVNAIGRDNVFLSIQESGSWDNTKGALRLLDSQLASKDIPRRIILDNTTHQDEISNPPAAARDGWIVTPNGQFERRRIPWLADLRNLVLEPLYEQQNAGIIYDKILFLNDVVFSVSYHNGAACIAAD